MSNSCVPVSIGLPVFNGERFLEAAIEGVLAQTWSDFELIVCDNASTDATEDICRKFAAHDPRICFYRNDKNVGAAENFNNVFRWSKGRYFKWCAHDDICDPDFLRCCVEVLEANPETVLCYTKQVDIDDDGNFLRENPYGFDPQLPLPHQRFASIMEFVRGAPAIWGLIRADVLRRTPLIAKYYASDLVLLAELTLHGCFHEVPRPLLRHRIHSERSVHAWNKWNYATWLDPKKRGLSLPTWRLFGEYLACVSRPPMGCAERLRCWLHAMKWFKWNWRFAKEDLVIAGRNLFAS